MSASSAEVSSSADKNLHGAKLLAPSNHVANSAIDLRLISCISNSSDEHSSADDGQRLGAMRLISCKYLSAYEVHKNPSLRVDPRPNSPMRPEGAFSYRPTLKCGQRAHSRPVVTPSASPSRPNSPHLRPPASDPPVESIWRMPCRSILGQSLLLWKHRLPPGLPKLLSHAGHPAAW